MAEAIYIIIDDSNPPRPEFVEIEKGPGESIGIGEDIYIDGLRHIKITAEDIEKA